MYRIGRSEAVAVGREVTAALSVTPDEEEVLP